MDKLYLLDHHLLNPKFGGGGWTHVTNVVKFLAKEFEITLVPRSTTLFYSDEDVERKAGEVERLGVKVLESYWDARKRIRKELSRLDKLLPYRLSKKYSKALNVKLENLYEPDHLGFDVFYLASNAYAFVMHEPVYYNDSLDYLKRLVKFYGVNVHTGKGFHTRFLYNELVAKKAKGIMKGKPPKLVGAVSRGVLEWSGLKGEVLFPGNAFERELTAFRCRGKEDYVMFWARLNQDKGVLELLDVMARLKRRTKLVVTGKFFDAYYEKKFWAKAKKLGVDVEYLGFVDRNTLLEKASKAKLLVYPSHVDGFSLTVLESLALGTPVVAYSIPTIRSVYGGLPGVKLVKEFDVEGMVKASDEFLQMGERELCDVMNDEKLMKFLELHSSWENVAREHLRLIKKAFGE